MITGLSTPSTSSIQMMSLMLSGAFLAYVIFVLLPFSRTRRWESGDPAAFEWHLLVPCRDEEAVIGDTLDYLRVCFPSAHLWIIDDASSDTTRAIVRSVAALDPRVHLVARDLPEARTGKGDALNEAYRQLLAYRASAGGASPDEVIVGVVDADGRPSANSFEIMAGPTLFADPTVGGVQVEVRMMNRDDRRPVPDRGRTANFAARTLVRMQDLEFRSVISAMQHSRTQLTGTTGMGGNGQFTRLSALCAIDEGDGRAWRGSLLEDFELGVHLLLAGWSNRFTDGAWVDQEGLFNLRRYLTQRTRWGQGVMQCMRYLPSIWGSPDVKSIGAIEMTYYLFQPWLALVGTVVFPLALVVFGYQLLTGATGVLGFALGWGWGLVLLYLFFGVGPFVIWGIIYQRRCEPERSSVTGLGWGFAYVLYVYAFYVTSWRAVGRMITGRHGWAKTRRNTEVVTAGPVALDR